MSVMQGTTKRPTVCRRNQHGAHLDLEATATAGTVIGPLPLKTSAVCGHDDAGKDHETTDCLDCIESAVSADGVDRRRLINGRSKRRRCAVGLHCTNHCAPRAQTLKAVDISHFNRSHNVVWLEGGCIIKHRPKTRTGFRPPSRGSYYTWQAPLDHCWRG